MITLVFTALWWLMLVSMAFSLAVTVVALGIYFHDLLGHSEAKQEGRAAAGAAPKSLAAVRALGNAKGQGAPEAEVGALHCAALINPVKKGGQILSGYRSRLLQYVSGGDRRCDRR